jgi:hypothetical protein
MRQRPYLVAYDYGAGGVWAYVVAPSREAISQLYPELTIFDVPPPWWTTEFEKYTHTYALDELPEKWAMARRLVAERGKL